jgi:hypothetical protein
MFSQASTLSNPLFLRLHAITYRANPPLLPQSLRLALYPSVYYSFFLPLPSCHGISISVTTLTSTVRARALPFQSTQRGAHAIRIFLVAVLYRLVSAAPVVNASLVRYSVMVPALPKVMLYFAFLRTPSHVSVSQLGGYGETCYSPRMLVLGSCLIDVLSRDPYS